MNEDVQVNSFPTRKVLPAAFETSPNLYNLQNDRLLYKRSTLRGIQYTPFSSRNKQPLPERGVGEPSDVALYVRTATGDATLLRLRNQGK